MSPRGLADLRRHFSAVRPTSSVWVSASLLRSNVALEDLSVRVRILAGPVVFEVPVGDCAQARSEVFEHRHVALEGSLHVGEIVTVG